MVHSTYKGTTIEISADYFPKPCETRVMQYFSFQLLPSSIVEVSVIGLTTVKKKTVNITEGITV